MGRIRVALLLGLSIAGLLALSSGGGAPEDSGGTTVVSSGGVEHTVNLESDPGIAEGHNGRSLGYINEHYDVDPPTAEVAPNPESVSTPDQRFQIKPYNREPRRSGLLVFSPGSGSAICTAWLVGMHTIATAGHCVHAGGTGSVADFFDEATYTFYPGYNAGLAPFGSCTIADGQLWTANEWVDSADDEFDWGGAQLDSCTGVPGGGPDIGGILGFFCFTHVLDPDGNAALIWGYPGDKVTAARPPTLWGSFGQVTSTSVRKIFYVNDTAGGQSGSAIQMAYTGKCQHMAVGIHAYGFGPGGPPPDNSGTRFTADLTQFFKDLRDDLL